MTALLTLAQVREHVETGLTDDAVQRIIDSEDAEIVRRYGAAATQTDILPGATEYLALSRPATSITSVSERVDTTTTALASDDYELWYGGQLLERLTTGTNGRELWGDRITVVYTPASTSAQRAVCLVQLVELAVRYNGVGAESIGGGDYSSTSADYQLERERLLRKIAPAGGMWIA